MSTSASPERTYGSARQYRFSYRAGACCPVCNATNWHIGRLTAECARCATALPIVQGLAA